MRPKIRCDGKSWKFWRFGRELKRAQERRPLSLPCLEASVRCEGSSRSALACKAATALQSEGEGRGIQCCCACHPQSLFHATLAAMCIRQACAALRLPVVFGTMPFGTWTSLSPLQSPNINPEINKLAVTGMTTEAPFRSKFFWILATVALSFVFDN